MARFPAAKPGEATHDFKVAAKSRIGHPDGSGKTLVGGDIITLTKPQAEFMMAKGHIDVELPDFEPQLPFDGPADASAKPLDSDEAKASTGSQADGEGDSDAGGVPEPDNVPAKGKGGGKSGRARTL